MYDILGKTEENGNVKTSKTLFQDLDFYFLGTMMKDNLPKKYLTCDKNTILQRQSIFKDISSNPDFADFIDRVCVQLENIVMLKNSSRQNKLRESNRNERDFAAFRELFFFVECIENICENGKRFCNKTAAGGLFEVFERIWEISASDWYKNARLYIERVGEELKNIKSISLGVNLDANLGVKEFGIVSLNSEYFTTNSIFDKMFGKNISSKEYICITPVSGDAMRYSGYSLEILNSSLYKSISEVVGGSVRKMSKSLYNMLSDNTEFLLSCYDDFKFISASCRYIFAIKDGGMPLCFPEMAAEHTIEGLYNPNFLGNISSEKIIKNDIDFDENGKIYILTGANSGGKTAFLRAVGIAQVLFQLGLPIPAESAKMPVYENIFSHFASNIKDVNGGRFENECKAIMDFYSNITENTLLLLDEMFSTTSSFEGEIVAVHILKNFARVGCKCIYTTHMHDLVYKTEEINRENGVKSRIDSLSAEVSGDVCTYKIIRKRELYGSLAEAICRKYGFIR